MFIEAARAVADQVTSDQLKLGMLFPPQSDILEVEVQTAARVAKLVFDADLARVDRRYGRIHSAAPLQARVPNTCVRKRVMAWPYPADGPEILARLLGWW